MIDARGWLDWTQVWPGVKDKVYSQPNSGEGIVCHSIEGSVAGAMSRFLATTKAADGSYTPNAQASVMFVNPLAGPLIQMYPVTASTWTSGNSKANTSLWAVESEGQAGTPLNDNQVANMLRLAGEWEARTGKNLERNKTLWEHNEVWNWGFPNAGPTACPSHRYDPVYAALAARTHEEDDMADPRVDKIIAALGGEAAIDAWNANGNSLLLGYGLEQQDQAEIRQAVAAIRDHLDPNSVPGPVPDHEHGGVKR